MCILTNIKEHSIEPVLHNTIILDNGEHIMPHIVLSQSHNEKIYYDNELIFRGITYDSNVMVNTLTGCYKIFIDIYKINDIVVKLIFRKKEDIIKKHSIKCLCNKCITYNLHILECNCSDNLMLIGDEEIYRSDKIIDNDYPDIELFDEHYVLPKVKTYKKNIDYEHRKNMIVKWNDIEWQKQHVEDVFNKQLMKNIIKV